MREAIVRYIPGHSKASIKLPLSKSISNRMLIINFLSGKSATKLKVSDAEDTMILLKCIETLEKPDGLNVLRVGEAGTAARFLTAMLCTTPGQHYVSCGPRMRERPMKPLFEALIGLGADIVFEEKPYHFPVRITGKRLNGGQLNLTNVSSSQFVSALLMIAPMLEGGLELLLNGPLSSEPYVLMTLELMKNQGIFFDYESRRIKVYESKYRKVSYRVEADWSSAAPFYSIIALRLAEEVFFENLSMNSIQGDKVLATIFNNLGVETEELPKGIFLRISDNRCTRFEYDFTDCPDLAQSVMLTVAALGLNGKFTGLHSLPLKETDRLAAMHQELDRIGIKCEMGDAFLEIEASEPLIPESAVETYNDHRMAMAFAPLAGIFGSFPINNPEVVVKSFPMFWKQIEQCGFFISPSL